MPFVSSLSGAKKRGNKTPPPTWDRPVGSHWRPSAPRSPRCPPAPRGRHPLRSSRRRLSRSSRPRHSRFCRRRRAHRMPRRRILRGRAPRRVRRNDDPVDAPSAGLGAEAAALRSQGRHMRPLGLASAGISIGLSIAAAVLSAPSRRLRRRSADPERSRIRARGNQFGSTGCSINSELVACQTSANNWPANGNGANGQHFHTASVTAAGEFHWVEANLGALEGRVTLIIRRTAHWAGRSSPPRTAPHSPTAVPGTACPSAIKA